MEKLNESIYGMYQRWNSGENGTRKEDVHEYVDLGLPSGLMWATCNLGADTVTEFGDFYLWGGIEPIKVSTAEIEDIPYYDKNEESYTKYNEEDGLTVLEPKDDAVHVAWGGKWRMPTKEEIQELIDNTTHDWVKNYLKSGVNGQLFTAKNGNELFIPAAYEGYNFTLLWSSSLQSEYYYAHDLVCDYNRINNHYVNRGTKRGVRGVF